MSWLKFSLLQSLSFVIPELFSDYQIKTEGRSESCIIGSISLLSVPCKLETMKGDVR